jgi:predicted dehydrogenase
MSIKKLKLGFIGGSVASAIGYTHFLASRLDGFFEVTSGCFSSREDINHESAKVYGIADDRVYDSWSDMLLAERGVIDAVVILLPIPGHHRAIISALENGIPVICEKPLVMNLNQALDVKSACESGKNFLTITYNYTGYPMIRELRQIISNGGLGRICHFQAEMPQESYMKEGASPQQWRLNKTSPSLISLDLMSHLHHMIDYLLGCSVKSMSASVNSFSRFSGVIDDINCSALYTNGVAGQYWVSKSSLGNRNGMKVRIFGSKGSAQWVQEHPEYLELAYSDGRKEILDRGCKTQIAGLPRYVRFKPGHPAGYIEAFANLYVDIAESLRLYISDKPTNNCELTTIEQEIDRMRFLEVIDISAKERKWIDIVYNGY